MFGLFLRVAALTVVYLAVLGSSQPGDLLIGLFLSLLLVGARGAVRSPGWTPPRSANRQLMQRLLGVPALIGGTVIDIGRGSWQVAGYCLGVYPLRTPGVVDVRINPCMQSSAAVWGIRVGINPDSVVVDIDEERGQMLVHVLDAHDPAAVRAEQWDTYQRRQRRVFP